MRVEAFRVLFALLFTFALTAWTEKGCVRWQNSETPLKVAEAEDDDSSDLFACVNTATFQDNFFTYRSERVAVPPQFESEHYNHSRDPPSSCH